MSFRRWVGRLLTWTNLFWLPMFSNGLPHVCGWSSVSPGTAPLRPTIMPVAIVKVKYSRVPRKTSIKISPNNSFQIAFMHFLNKTNACFQVVRGYLPKYKTKVRESRGFDGWYKKQRPDNWIPFLMVAKGLSQGMLIQLFHYKIRSHCVLCYCVYLHVLRTKQWFYLTWYTLILTLNSIWVIWLTDNFMVVGGIKMYLFFQAVIFRKCIS